MNERDANTIISGAREALLSVSSGEDVAAYYFDELARFLTYGCDEAEKFLSLYRKMKEEIFASLNVNSSACVSLISHFCRAVCRYSDEKGRKISISDFFESEELTGGRITYVRNALSDEAYRIFERVVENASVEYSGSFASACEEVYYGRVPYCILPYENSEEGALSGFMRLINKYELYPHYVCSCASEGTVTRFALLGRAPCIIADKKREMRVRVSFHGLECGALSGVSHAASALGLSLIKTESVPLRWDEGRYGVSITFSANSENALPYLLYLAIEISECSDKAIYYKI